MYRRKFPNAYREYEDMLKKMGSGAEPVLVDGKLRGWREKKIKNDFQKVGSRYGFKKNSDIEILYKEQLKNKQKLEHEKYKIILNKEVPSDFEEFEQMKYNEVEKWANLQNKMHGKLKNIPYNPNLDQKLENIEARIWYLSNDAKIPNNKNMSLRLENRSKELYDERESNKINARKMMFDVRSKAILDFREPIISFEQRILKKMNEKGLTLEEAYEDIIRTASVTRKSVNKRFGLE